MSRFLTTSLTYVLLLAVVTAVLWTVLVGARPTATDLVSVRHTVAVWWQQ